LHIIRIFFGDKKQLPLSALRTSSEVAERRFERNAIKRKAAGEISAAWTDFDISRVIAED